MKFTGVIVFAAVGLLALACSGEGESSKSSPLENEPARLQPGINAGNGESSSNTGSLAGSMIAGTAPGDCTGTIAGAGPVVDLGGSPLQPLAMEVGTAMADAYRFRAEFGYLQVTVRSDVAGRARVFEQGPAGRAALTWNVDRMQASTETLGLPSPLEAESLAKQSCP